MSEFLGKPRFTEQVASRATKPDESRKRSLYFLLLAIGRQRALRNPLFRDEYRQAFDSLKIEKVEDLWNITVNVNGTQINQSLERSTFKFYATGFSENEDSTVESNKITANKYWARVESQIGIRDSLDGLKTKNPLTGPSFNSSLDITSLVLMIIPLLYSLGASQTMIPGLLVALYPTARLFWHSSKKVIFSLLYILAFLVFALNLDSPGLNSNNPSFLAETAISFLIWARLYKSRYQVRLNSKRIVLLALLFVAFTAFATFSGPKPYLSIFTVFMIFTSEFMQYLRKRSIHSTRAVITTMLLEIILSLTFLMTIVHFGLEGIEISPIEVLFFVIVYLIWFIYLNIYERYPITLRLTYPIVVAFVILNHAFSSTFLLVALIAIIISILASKTENK